MTALKLDVVSAEQSLYSGTVKMVVLPGESGELGVLPGHTFDYRIRPGTVRITKEDGTQEVVFVAGGILEVQPYAVTVLADVAVRLEELDAPRLKSLVKAQETLKNASTPQKSALLKLNLLYCKLKWLHYSVIKILVLTTNQSVRFIKTPQTMYLVVGFSRLGVKNLSKNIKPFSVTIPSIALS